MNTRSQRPWLATAILVGALYCVVGVALAAPSTHVRVWRLAAWLISAAVYAAHIGHEHFRLRNPPVSAAAHVAVAAGIGGFALAVAAGVHSLFVPPNYQRSLFILALVVWPVVTGVPAFLVALAATAVSARLPGKRPAE